MSDHFKIRWNNYSSILQNVFRKRLECEQFVDVTLACEGQSIKCHRLILSACSTYFNRILSDNQNSNLVIYVTNMKFWQLDALVTFMYTGEVSISQQKLPHLCKAAEGLKIKGFATDTTDLADSDLDGLEEDDMEVFHVEESNSVQSSSLASLPPQRIKRKLMPRPPKLKKMQRVERPANGPESTTGSNLKQHSISTADQKLPILLKMTESGNRGASTEKESFEDDGDDEAYENEITTGSKDDGEGVMDEEENDDMEGGDESDSLGSEGDDSDSQQAGRPNKVALKYGQQLRDSALTALQSGMPMRECSETFGISRKTISGWRTRELENDGWEENTPFQNRSFLTKEDGNSAPIISTSGITLPPKTTMGAPVNSAERAERLKKATELALIGVTVRQAAAHFDIPRTTLCAYMKRRGLAAKRNIIPNNGNGQNNSRASGPLKKASIRAEVSGETNGQATAESHYEDFPGISELINEVGQENYDGNEEYADGEGEYNYIVV